MPPLLQVALNGSRDHPRAPRTPDDLAEEGRAAVDAGARVLHLHPYDATGRQTLAAEPCAAALRAVHHGEGIASWAVNERALRRGHGIRTGLEDTTVLPDGRPAPDNAALVRAAVALVTKLDRAH